MRCIMCEHFRRLDQRTQPARVVCARHTDGIEVDPHQGCGKGKPKSKSSMLWSNGTGKNW